ncbi:glycoside hydrolase family 97 protein [Gracilimonas mengyeensis]|uniref:Glycosyl-hydrolase 97 C-terminal, oligomerisation n=1 Tax=Gracilimonas mengyeensis TaxID=1302730 RepID=A0A521AY95_9BACT|nr:glycoside hydrolase family 97 protein [Gracilimonas mengyeensis]SMO39786.1 Glycosyl-hydrolase 97 C-terminal, oligomerisation [Gracilimonas mengyeensis]
MRLNDDILYMKITSLVHIALLVLFATSCSGLDNKDTLQSEGSEIAMNFMLMDDHQPAYQVIVDNEVVVDTSQLGLVMDGTDFSKNMTLREITGPNRVQDEYSLLHGKQTHIKYNAKKKTYYLEHQSGQKMNIEFQVSDESVAFRYIFPGESDQLHHISEEKTHFNFPAETRAWLQPLANVNTGFAQTNPSYEEHYFIDVEVGTPAPNEAGWAYPALFKSGNTWVLISETGMDGSYSATRLKQQSPNGNYQVGFPQEGEQFPDRALLPESELPWTSPWRIMAIGDLKTITESTLGTDLAEPVALEDTSWIEPGRASWSWAKLKDASVNYDTQKEFIDYAADMGWEYTLVDVNWDVNIGYDRIAELADYAATKDVGLILWYNSSGSWNETVYTPKSKLLDREQRRAEFARLEEMGIKGVKVDFFAGDGQSMMQYYIDIFEDAADHHLLVNTHGTTLPRGWHRTWPNLVTMESVKGFEFVTFEQPNADLEAEHSTLLPFTRNVFSPMDFTPMSLTELFNVKRQTTSSFELALPVLFTSGIQHYAETAEGMEEVPDYVKDFVKKIPVRWDEMRFIDGYPGKEVIIARRAGDTWFVAGINGEKKAKNLSVDLSFLPDHKTGTLISDGEARFDFQKDSISLSDSEIHEISVEANGGFVILFEEETNKQSELNDNRNGSDDNERI